MVEDRVPKTAFIIQAHKNPNQLNGFIQQLIINDYADVYIHLDKKSYNNLYNKIIRHPNVKILEESIDVQWGDISQVDATLLLIRSVLATNIKYDFICFRSGQDLLVKKNFKEYLLNNRKKIFISTDKIDKKNAYAALPVCKWPKFLRKRYSIYHPFRVIRRIIISLYGLGLNILPTSNNLPRNYSLYQGSCWFCIPFEVGLYLLEFLDKNTWYYLSFKNALCPDEWFFQTLIMNTGYKTRVVNDELVYLRWGDTLLTRNHPVNLRIDDKEEIEISNKFFARKFDEDVDKDIINYYLKRIHI